MCKKLLFLFLVLLLAFSTAVFAQKTKPKVSKTPAAKNNLTKPAKPAAKVKNEKEEFEKALAQTDLALKIGALQQFAADFPNSENKTRALENVVSTRAQQADDRLRAGDAAAVELFKQAVADAPAPLSEKLFADVILQFPTNLFYGGQQPAAIEIAKLIEEKIIDKPRQFLGLATFYLGTENAAEAKRLAEKAIAIDGTLPAAYQTLGLANRLNFQLEEAEKAYAKALEIDANSVVSKRSLAEMKRALGKSGEAATLYRELLEKDATDGAARNGLILSLFDGGKQAEAETEFNQSLAANPNNLPLLVGAAYWYAAHGQGEKAVDFAQKALAVEPRYTWAYIALSRGLLAQNEPLEAEKVLLSARRYGNFPTLNYEIAAARMSAGFFREAANELKKSFTIKDGVIETKLANRVPKQSANFIELLELERRASIFEPAAADTAENAGKIKSLLTLNQKAEAAAATDEQLNQAADEFVKGDDKMKAHRELYAANLLLEKKKSFPKVMQLTQGAVKNLDSSLEVASPGAAILADELFASRTLAISRGEVIIVPEVPRQTLSAIMRGRIEEIFGWTLYQQGKTAESVVRLKRAVSILPEKSAWWRSSLWRLGVALEADGNSKDALDSYIKSYASGEPNLSRRKVIESVYLKVNGNLDGLDAKIGAAPTETVAQNTTTPTTETTPTPAPTSTPEITSTPEVKSTPEAVPTTAATPAVTSTPEVKTEAAPTVGTTPTPTPVITAEPKATPESTPEIKTEPTEKAITPEVKTEPTPAASPAAQTENPNIAAAEKATAKPLEKVEKDSSKSPFDPIIINVPKRDEKPVPQNEKPAETKEMPAETVEKPADKKPDKETQSETPVKEKEIEKIPENKRESSRPRVVVTDNLPSSESTCLVASQDSISILSRGGNLGVSIGYTQENDISKITAESSSSEDVSVAPDSGIGKQSNRAFFVIKSISSKLGNFTVTFNSPCGRKEIRVTVR